MPVPELSFKVFTVQQYCSFWIESRTVIAEEITAVLRRIEPISQLVRQLVDRGDVDAGMAMVRDFDSDDCGYNATGWVLTREQIELLAAMGADLQADEHLENGEPSEYDDEE